MRPQILRRSHFSQARSVTKGGTECTHGARLCVIFSGHAPPSELDHFMRRITRDFRPLVLKLGVGTSFIIALTTPVHAYLDPGTGSMLLQGLIAGVAGAMLVVKLYWARFKTFFSGKRSDNQTDQTTTSASENSVEQ